MNTLTDVLTAGSGDWGRADPAGEIVARLSGKRQGSGWMARCPMHDDHNPSLSIHVESGRVLVHCHAGCSQKDVVDYLKASRLWPESGSGRSSGASHRPGHGGRGGTSAPAAAQPRTDRPLNPPVSTARRLTAATVYEYRDVEGRLIALKTRYDSTQGAQRSKRFRWALPDGTARLGGIVPPLYGSEKLAATDARCPVYLVEGEACVHQLESRGFVAVSPPNGAESPWLASYSAALRDRDVVLMPDHDMAGRRLMDRAARALHGTARQLRWIDLPVAAPGADIVDFAAQADDQQYADVLRNPTRWTPSSHPLAAPPEASRPRVTLVVMADVRHEPVEWLWEPYLPRGKFCLLEGDPGRGKSFLSARLCADVSVGRVPMKEAFVAPASCLLLIGEDGLADTVRPRLEAMNADLSRIHAVTGTITDQGEGDLTLDEQGIALLRAQVERERPALVVIDPLVVYLGAQLDIYKANEVRAVLRPLAQIAEEFGCTVVGLRHLNKSTGGQNALYRGQFSIDFAAAARSILLVGADPEDPGRSILAHTKASLSGRGAPVGFRLADGRFAWDGTADLTADDLLALPTDGGATPLQEAIEFLLDALKDGGIPSSEIVRAARDLGIAERTLRRARQQLEIEARRCGVVGRRGGGGWFWNLPQAERASALEA